MSTSESTHKGSNEGFGIFLVCGWMHSNNLRYAKIRKTGWRFKSISTYYDYFYTHACISFFFHLSGSTRLRLYVVVTAILICIRITWCNNGWCCTAKNRKVSVSKLKKSSVFLIAFCWWYYCLFCFRFYQSIINTAYLVRNNRYWKSLHIALLATHVH